VTTFASKSSQPLTHRAIEARNYGRIEHAASQGGLQERVGLFQGSPRHLPEYFHDPLLLRALDDGRDTPLRPHLQIRSPPSCRAFDFFPKRPLDAARICRPAIGTHQKGL
jgi:hypothetical protein